MFVPDRVGGVEFPEVEDVLAVAGWGLRKVGGGGQRKLACNLQGQGWTSTEGILAGLTTVSYTHLTLPTIYSV